MRVTGIIVDIKDAQKVTETFTKREVWLELPDEKYPQTISVEFVQDKCAILDNYKIGQEVFIEINIRGRMHKDKVFNTLQGWRIELVPTANTDKMVRQEDMGRTNPIFPASNPAEDDLPF